MSSGQAGQGSAAVGAATGGGDAAEPGPKRRRLLDPGGPIEDDETARQKMRDARVYERGGGGTEGECVGFDPANVRDVKSKIPYEDADDQNAITPMGYFATSPTKRGDLPMMRWLYVNGADTRDEDIAWNFPMYRATIHGEMEVCKWLFDHGAAKDVKRRTTGSNSRSPLTNTVWNGPYSLTLSRWLILNGALCKDGDSGELDVEIMRQDLGSQYLIQERKALLDWANDLHRARTSFLLFLSGALSRPKHAYHTRRSSSPVRILSGESGVLELIGDYVGFVRGREARIIRQLTEMLPDMLPDFD